MTSVIEPHDDPGPAPDRPVHHSPDVESMLAEAIDMVDHARPMPLSTSSMINREELLAVLEAVVDTLPDELRAARWLLREREEYLERARLEGEEILGLARSRAERMVERTEVVKSAEARAQRILNDAEAEARLMRRETEDFCDARLASLEGILDRTRTVVATGRNRLQGTGAQPPVDLTDEPIDMVEGAELFDQDLS